MAKENPTANAPDGLFVRIKISGHIEKAKEKDFIKRLDRLMAQFADGRVVCSMYRNGK